MYAKDFYIGFSR